MNKRMSKVVMTAALSASLAVFGCGAALTANAAVDTGTAYIYVVDVQDGGACYQGEGSGANTINAAATNAKIEADGKFTVELDLSKESTITTITEFKKLKLYVVGTENTKNVTFTVNELKVNDKAVALQSAPEFKTSENDYYADLWDVDGAQLFDRMNDDVMNATKVSVTFEVAGWPKEEESSEVSSEASSASSSEASSSQASSSQASSAASSAASSSSTAPSESNTPTGDTGVAGVAALAVAAAAVACVGAVAAKKKD